MIKTLNEEEVKDEKKMGQPWPDNDDQFETWNFPFQAMRDHQSFSTIETQHKITEFIDKGNI